MIKRARLQAAASANLLFLGRRLRGVWEGLGGKSVTLTHITGIHDPLLSTVQRQLKGAFNHDSIVDGHGAVERRYDSWCEVDQTCHTTIGDMDSRLSQDKLETGLHLHWYADD